MTQPTSPAPPPDAPVVLYDTTLRDGTQGENITLSLADKIRVARMLDEFGMPFIEGGWPGSNPKDIEFFAAARTMRWERARLAAFGSTRHRSNKPGDDPNLRELVAAETPVVTIFGKSWLLHVVEVLGATPAENLDMIADSVGFVVDRGRETIYDAEHFFDGFKEDPEFAMETLWAAARAGAETVVLCDTNGGSMPWDIEERVKAIAAVLPCPVGIHAHDDAGCGVANSLAAVRGGATHVQGTMNGYGERCGNANLCSIVPTLALKMGLRSVREGALSELTHVAWQVAEIANLSPDAHAPYVGRSAFAHKGGVHVAAIRRSPRAYEHIDPALVGNHTRVVVSELSGRGNVLSKAEEYEVELDPGAEAAVLRGVKEGEARGYAYEAAEASVALMMRRQAPGYTPPFELVDYKVMVGRRVGEEPVSDAAIKIRVRGEIVHTAAEGNGPVSALDLALRKALVGAYPAVTGIRLEDYKVRILDGNTGTGATTRVMIENGFGEERWTTVGASENVLEASWVALADGIEYGLAVALAAQREEKGAAE
jgi:2-isopropylmalate synthase